MHPAPSIILFTVLSGFGFGLISIVGLLQFLNQISTVDIVIFSAIGLFFSIIGLISSFFHLANKKNAIKSMSQWQTSWLSREAISSIFCLSIVVGNIGWVFIQNRFSNKFFSSHIRFHYRFNYIIWNIFKICNKLLSIFR